MFYDRACRLLATITAPGDAFGVRYLFDHSTFVVDRFHFFHHSPADSLCRDYCNPYDVANKGMVHVHRRIPVDDAGDRPRLSDGIGMEVRRQIMLPNGVHKSVSRRVVRQEEPEGSGVWFEYECEDVGNTEVAEQTFNMLRGFKGMIRGMRMNYACSFFAPWLTT